MNKRSFSLAFLFAIVLLALVKLGSAQDTGSLPTNQELATKSHLICVESKTYFMKQAELEKALLGRKDFQEWGLQVTRDQNQADLIVTVVRASFQNNFPYTVTHRATGTVLFGGEVNSLGGTVYNKIARDMMEKMQEVREGGVPGKKK